MRRSPRSCIIKAWFSIWILALLFSIPSRGATVDIYRDAYGVPSILSETDEGALFGLGWVHAEDRAFQMHFSLRIIQGRTAELFGEIDKQKAGDTTVTHDRKMRLMGYYHSATRVAANLDPETQALLQAYCDGVNDYIEQHSDSLLHLFETYELSPEPWTPADCIAVWWNMGKFFSGEGLHDTLTYHRQMEEEPGRERPPRGDRGNPQLQELMRRARSFTPPKDDSAAVVQRTDVTDEWLDEVHAFIQEKAALVEDDSSGEITPKFSHAWVVGGEKTTTGSSVLVSDPQTPVRNPSLFYEAHYAGKTFNVRGIGVAGSPIILIGFTESVAWGLTALGADQADQFFIDVHPDDPTRYRFEGEWQTMEVRSEEIRVRDGESIPLEIRETRFGPIINGIAHGVREGETVALKRIPQAETGRETIQGYLAMIRADNTAAFSTALEGWRFPSANIVFGDKHGDIGFWTMAAIPMRSPLSRQGGRATHMGTESERDWLGIMPYKYLPHVINPERGHIHSGNHRPIGSFYPSLLGISTGSAGDTDRSWRLHQRLNDQDKFTPADVLDIHYDTTNAIKKSLITIAKYLHAADSPFSEPATQALEYLHDWHENGSKSDLRIIGTELANEIPTQFRLMNSELAFQYGGGLSGLCFMLKTLEQQMEEETELDPLVGEYLDDILSQAWHSAERKYGRNPDRWNSNAQQAITRRPMPYFETLDRFYGLDESLDMTFPGLYCIDGGTILSQAAQSYTQFVPMHNPDEALSMLPIGQSEHPDSPYRTATFDLWAKGELKPAPISRNRIQERHNHIVQLVRETKPK